MQAIIYQETTSLNDEKVLTLDTDNRTNSHQKKKYMMHKYWGKKPSNELSEIISKFSISGDLLLDPLAGYGGFSSEAVLSGRNVISNDLNPIANFINHCLLMVDVDLDKLISYYETVNERIRDCEEFWYSYKENTNDEKIITTLRDRGGKALKLKVARDKNVIEKDMSAESQLNLENKEKNYKINEWYPKNKLISNSRISSKKGMTVDQLFDVRSLACHAKLYYEVNDLPNSNEKDLLLLAFTSNLANCSKLVPPIKSRGEMSQGAWMTGFYIGDRYLENNVFHYYRNRFSKILAGKHEYITQYYDMFHKGAYKITNNDAKSLEIEDESIDLVFTDFPYGDAVPYFEQSSIWNAWMRFDVDYDNEIIISDSKERDKGHTQYKSDITKAINEIYRVLKTNKHFIFSYHSLSGIEWSSITSALLKAGFVIEDCQMIAQKTFTPRQLNRTKTIKGDLILICKKCKSKPRYTPTVSLQDEENFVNSLFIQTLKAGVYYTNDIIIYFLKLFFDSRVVVSNMNIISNLEKIADFDGKGWVLSENI